MPHVADPEQPGTATEGEAASGRVTPLAFWR